MLGRALLSANRLQVVPRRSMAALKNWKRPTIEEIGIPTESWQTVNRRVNSRYNMYLALGVGFFAVTCLAGNMSGAFNPHATPYHVFDKKGTKDL